MSNYCFHIDVTTNAVTAAVLATVVVQLVFTSVNTMAKDILNYYDYEIC